MNISFFSSSAFTIPILKSIIENQGGNIGELAYKQLQDLRKKYPYHSEQSEDSFDTKQNTRIAASHAPDNDIALLPKELQNLCQKDFDTAELNSKINLKFVTTQPDRINRKKVISNPVAIFARKHNIKTYTPEKINEELEEFTKIAKNLDIAITASFGQIISEEILVIPKYGFINWHPSKLPEYRGATPMQTAIKEGKTETALSWINMTKGMDEGAIYTQTTYQIKPDETIKEMAEKMGILGAETWALTVALKVIASKTRQSPKNSYQPISQKKDQATFCSMLSKKDSLVYPKNQTATEIYNHYRAYLTFPGTKFFCEYFGQQVKLIEIAKVLNEQDFQQLGNHSQITTNQPNGSFWIQIKNNKRTRTFLKCKNGFLELKSVGLSNGKNIDFSGFIF